MEYEKCYVYNPGNARPAKRRKVDHQGLHASWPARRRAFETAWPARQSNIDARIHELTLRYVEHIEIFLEEPLQSGQHDRIPTAILVCGPETASYNKVLDHLASTLTTRKDIVMSRISPGAGTNLKSLLKSIIHNATSREDGLDDQNDDEPLQSKKGTRLPNYDLQLLADFAIERNLKQVIVAIDNTEAFDSVLLSEFIEILGYWRNRIPFIVFLGVATSIHPLQQRLSRAAVRCLQGKAIDVSGPQEELEHALEGAAQNNPVVWPGADFVEPILERQQDYIQCIDSFVHSIKYAYMSHYYANPLSLFLVPGIEFTAVPPDHFDALRNVNSFRVYCQDLLQKGDVKQLRGLLDSDMELFALATEKIRQVQHKLCGILPALRVLQRILHIVLKSYTTLDSSLSKLYTSALSGRLTPGSSLIRSTLLTIRKSPFATVIKISALLDEGLPASFTGDYAHQFADGHQQLVELYKLAVADKDELRSEEEIRNSTLRTTVVARKVELSKQKATLSERDQTYTALVKRMTDLLESYFERWLLNPKDLIFNELVIYNLQSPQREVFTPRPRHAIERALATPHDYLDCECCAPDAGENAGVDEVTLASTQPPTAVLYQLYLESGSLINVHDLWQAFRAVMMSSSQEATKSAEEGLMALFQRSLVELQYLDFVKPTRKRADHVAKVAWRGL